MEGIVDDEDLKKMVTEVTPTRINMGLDHNDIEAYISKASFNDVNF